MDDGVKCPICGEWRVLLDWGGYERRMEMTPAGGKCLDCGHKLTERQARDAHLASWLEESRMEELKRLYGLEKALIDTVAVLCLTCEALGLAVPSLDEEMPVCNRIDLMIEAMHKEISGLRKDADELKKNKGESG